MPVELHGLAEALCQTPDLRGASPDDVEAGLARAEAPIRLRLPNEGVSVPLVHSGELQTHLLFVQSGAMFPWGHPPTELHAPFLVGIHEFVTGSDRWYANNSAVVGSTIIEVPREAIEHIALACPELRDQWVQLAVHRTARVYWDSLSIAGSPMTRVAAALVARLAIRGEDFGGDRMLSVRQQDLMRQTMLSRTAAANGVQALEQAGIVADSGRSDGPRYFSGRILIPDVARLRDVATADVRETLIERFESRED